MGVRLCKPEPPASSSLPRQALSPLGLQDGHVRSPVLSQHLRSSSSPCPSHPAIYTDPHTLSWPAPLTPAEHDLLPITGAQEGAARACAWRQLAVCVHVFVRAHVSLCVHVYMHVYAHVCVSVCLCVCVCMCACVLGACFVQAHRTLSPAAVRQRVLNEGRLCWPSPTPEPGPAGHHPPSSPPAAGARKERNHYRHKGSRSAEDAFS